MILYGRRIKINRSPIRERKGLCGDDDDDRKVELCRHLGGSSEGTRKRGKILRGQGEKFGDHATYRQTEHFDLFLGS